ncbi:LLM class flavin-dependent oxidoreductase [soil metagenome]
MSELLIGVDLSASAVPGANPVEAACEAERLGYDFVSASDHPAGPRPTYEVWTLLTWIAAATRRIRLASRVLAVPLRSPAMVAKMAESLDRLAGGRLILGLGGGYSDDELAAFGAGRPTPGEKVDGLEEAVRIIRALWTQPDVNFGGRRYRVEHAELAPRPGRPIPIWLGTYGDRALAVTGRLADGWIPSLSFAPPEQVAVMHRRLLDAAGAAGRDPGTITCVYNVEVRLDRRPAEAPPHVVAGPPEAVVERLAGFLGLGFTAFNILPTGRDRSMQVERIGREVLPELRRAAG